MDEFSKLFTSLRGLRLKDHERAQMRASLMTFMRENPLKVSAWRVFLKEMTFLTLTVRVHPLVTAFVLVLCVATGTSYAAENALPGEALYAVKTNVNEKAVGAFAISHAAKVEWGATLADRRLSEAEELVAENRLTPATAASIHSGLADATRPFDDAVAAGASDTEVSDAQSDLQASLQAHVHVLTALDTPETSASSTSQVAEILQSVHERARGIAEARNKSGKKTDGNQSEQFRDVVAAKRQDAENAVQTLHQLAAVAKDSFGTTTSDDVTSGAIQAAERVTAGTKRLDEGDLNGALGSYQAAIRAARETKISLDAANHVRKNLRGRRNGQNENLSGATQQAAGISTSTPVEVVVPVAATQEVATEPAPTTLTATFERRTDSGERKGKEHGDSNDSHDSEDDDSVRVDLHF